MIFQNKLAILLIIQWKLKFPELIKSVAINAVKINRTGEIQRKFALMISDKRTFVNDV